MCDDISDSEWEKIEDRVLYNIPIGTVKTYDDFRRKLTDKFFGSNPVRTRKEKKFQDILWNDLADVYEEGIGEKKPEYVSISFKEHPAEAKRFSRSMKFYSNILKLFNKGYHRKTIVKHYSKKTQRKESTINRDISALVKLGLIRKRAGKRGYYASKTSVYV